MGTFKKAPQGMVGQSFNHTAINNATVGDLVYMTAVDMTVDTATTQRPIGEIVAIDKLANNGLGKVTVELFGNKILDLIVGASAVTAGNFVKLSAKNTVIPATLTATPAAIGDLADVNEAFGIALNGGATGVTIHVTLL